MKTILVFIFSFCILQNGLTQMQQELELNQREIPSKDAFFRTFEIPLNNYIIEGLASIDLENDGIHELVVLTKVDGFIEQGKLQIYKWKNDRFELFWDSGTKMGYPYGIQIVDMNNDGYDDILVSCAGLQLYLNYSGNIYFHGIIVPTTTQDPFLASDLNNDNKKDLGIGSPGSNANFSIKLYQQNEEIDFSYQSMLSGVVGSNLVKPFNYNNDGLCDILNVNTYDGVVLVYQNNNDFNFDLVFVYYCNNRTFCIDAADFDNDGFDDFLISEAWANIHIFKNYQDTFKNEYSGSNIGICFYTVTKDINKDGLVDIIAATYDGSIYVYENLGNFKFREISTSLYASQNAGCTLGDFDGDGMADLAYGINPVKITFNVGATLNLAGNGTGITSVNEKHSLKIFPNPTKDIISIKAEDSNQQIYDFNIKVYDSIGRVVYESSFNQNSVEINMREFGSNGLYFVQIIDNIQHIITKSKVLLE